MRIARATLLSAVLATTLLVAPSVTASAGLDEGSLTVAAQAQLTMGCNPCGGAPLTGSSSGQVSGDLNGIAYAVTWPDPTQAATIANNLTGSLDYYTPCTGSLSINGVIDGSSTYTVSGALLVYNGNAYHGATVTGNLSGQWSGNAALVNTQTLTIQWSTSITISIPVASLSQGVVTMQPMSPLQNCLSSGTQTYKIAGQVFTTL